MTLDPSKSRTQFRKGDGSLSSSTSDALTISRTDLAAIVSAGSYDENIPTGFFTQTAKRESAFRYNEEDFDYNTDGSLREHSKGLYQISDDEAAAVGMAGADLDDPDVASAVFQLLMERNLGLRPSLLHGQESIADACQAFGTPIDLANPPPDVWFYLALSHNMGLPSTTKSIRTYGLNAQAWIDRNPKLSRQISYGSEIMQAALEGAPSAFHEAVSSLVNDAKGDPSTWKRAALVGGATVVAIIALEWLLSRAPRGAPS